jgi:spore germination cell wall hydrolase CwlJ-like protein
MKQLKGLKQITLLILILILFLSLQGMTVNAATSKTSRSSIKASTTDINTLAAVCYLEAGTNYNNCLAVANVVLNRVQSKSYPNTITGVVYQKSQFSVAKRVKYYVNKPKSTCLKAVKAALAGTNNIGTRKSFRSASYAKGKSYKNSVRIGDNVFF